MQKGIRTIIIANLLCFLAGARFSASVMAQQRPVVVRPVEDQRPLDIDTDAASCGKLFNAANGYSNNFMYQEEYDTSKKYIETCPSDPFSFRAFQFMTEAVAHLSGNHDPLRSIYLGWLKSVLYLNTANPEYFCQGVLAIGSELPPYPDTLSGARSKDVNIPLAVIQWLILNSDCDHDHSLSKLYKNGRKSQFDTWNSNESAYKLTHPFDTTLPSMAQLGLDTVLAKHFQYALVKGGADNFSSIVPSYNVTKNPTDGATELRFTLGSDAYVNVEVHDVLGRLVSGDAVGKILSVGDHRVPIDISNYPAGTYYLSITLGTGEVRTVKLVKK